MAMIRSGTLVIENEGSRQEYTLDGGFVDVTPQGVTVLAETILEGAAQEA
jgi:F0F1-type ATP synthase epsilon subunit